MCLYSAWTQPPYNDKNSLLFFNPQKPKHSHLSSHFDFGVNTSALFHLQWGETLEQGTEPLTAPRALQQSGCVFTAVCVHLDGFNAEHKFRVWVTISGHTSLHFTSHSLNSFIRVSTDMNKFNLRLFKTFLIPPYVKFKTKPVIEIHIILHTHI